MARRPLSSYEEKMDDIMRYVSMRVDGKSRVKVRNKEDLRQLILKLDDVRRPTKKGTRGNPKITPDFVDSLLQTRRSNAYIGADIGRGTKYTAPTTALDSTKEHTRTINATVNKKQPSRAKKKLQERIQKKRKKKR